MCIRDSSWISETSSLASIGDLVRENTNSLGSIHGSSKIYPSAEICKKIASILNGASPLLSFGTTI